MNGRKREFTFLIGLLVLGLLVALATKERALLWSTVFAAVTGIV